MSRELTEKDQELIAMGVRAERHAYSLYLLNKEDWEVRIGPEGIHMVRDGHVAAGPLTSHLDLDAWGAKQLQRLALERLDWPRGNA